MNEYQKPQQTGGYPARYSVLTPIGVEYRSTAKRPGTEYRVSTAQYRVPESESGARGQAAPHFPGSARDLSKPRAREGASPSLEPRSSGAARGIPAMTGKNRAPAMAIAHRDARRGAPSPETAITAERGTTR